MAEKNDHLSSEKSFGSQALDKIVSRLRTTSDPKRRYEYVLWLAKKLPVLSSDSHSPFNKVQGCISEVYVIGELIKGKIHWKGYSDALITKGLLALLIEGLNNLSPQEVLMIDEGFIKETGLQSSLTPSRANGFLNILLKMKSQAQHLSSNSSSELNRVL
tara:strand:- start:11967 stop:12446 length:480 start_codon:yes stop_codon:yes gene_type:complete